MTSALVAPARAPGVELLGPLSGSGYRRPQGLVRRADGQTVQLTPVLYALVELLDGHRDVGALADALSDEVGKRVSAADVEQLLGRLRPLGILEGTGGTQLPKAQPLLGLRWKFVITDQAITNRVAGVFAPLLSPYLVVPALAAFVGVCWLVLVEKGLGSATHRAFFEPGLLLAVFAVTVLSAGFHELGHAAACRYGGAKPGAMGAGLYVVWPAFYTDVGDAYRLSRWGRLRVDLGGLYFNVLVADAVLLAWLVWREDALLLVVATQLLQMVRQLAPYIRSDGYHILSDLTGVPDLFQHLGPTLRRLLPWNWGEPSPLRRRARWLVTGWTLLVTPLLVGMLLMGVLLLPRLVATAWESGQVQVDRMGTSDLVASGAAALKLVALVLPVVAITVMLLRLVTRAARRVWSSTEDRPRSRATVVLAALVAALLLVMAWWPSGQYDTVGANERGSLTSLPSALGGGGTVAMQEQVLATAMVPQSGTGPVLLLLPGEDEPRAVVTSTAAQTETVPTEDATSAGRDFPFAIPDPPGEGDNQALAVGERDGATVYDIAYAVVTITDGSPVTSTNEAFALASCSFCTTVAVAFQIVLVVGQADVVVPVNTAVAGNAYCLQCVTTALAVQLVATVSALPDDEVYQDLQAALAKLDGLEGLSTAEVWEQVQQVEAEVLQVLADSGLVEGLTGSAVTATATPSPVRSAEPSPSAQPSVSSTPAPSATPTQEVAPPSPSVSPSAPVDASPTTSP